MAFKEKMRKGSINIRLKNNANVRIPIQILGSKAATIKNTDQDTIVSWDLSSEDFVGSTVTITTATPYTVQLLQSNILGVVNALNTLEIAFFFSSGTTLYAIYLADASVATADIDIDNIAWNIEGWEQNKSVTSNYVQTLINGVFAYNNGLFLFMGDSIAGRQFRFPLVSAWDIETIQASDQFNTSFGDWSSFGDSGTYRYKKILSSAVGNRNPMLTPYDLATGQADDEQNLALASGDLLYFIDSGLVFFSFTGSTIFQYTASNPWSIVAPSATTSINVNGIIPNDGLVFFGLQFSTDGTRAFIFKQSALAPFSAIVYQVDCATPNDILTAVYNGIFINILTNAPEPMNSVQFRTDGKRFFTIYDDGAGNQTISEFG